MTTKFDAMSTLKDCPFCGSNRTGGNYTRDGWQAGCNECGARVTAFNPDAIQKSADKWNRRAKAHGGESAMTTTDTPPTDGSYYAQGEFVRRAPTITKTGATFGFCVGRMQDEEYSPHVAAALNAYTHVERAATLLQRKAYWHGRMAGHYIKQAKEADHQGFDLEAHYMADAISEQIDAAAASLTARQLMGIE